MYRNRAREKDSIRGIIENVCSLERKRVCGID